MAEDQDKNKDYTDTERKEKQIRKEAAIDAAFQNPDNSVIPVDLDSEMKKAFIDYAMSVISDRALPDIRDGLKPVHRRILYSMFTQGFTPDKPYRKCATTVGDVLGRFHPHGDASVYDALVRLAQDFSMRHILVEGHGNFGSRDGDSAAAYRYTEARLAKLSMEMMRDINKDTVDFQPNFDEHVMEPVVLPARLPNLLINGSTGIAVGMATNIPPHNLGEVIDSVMHLIDYPDATTEDLMQFVKGPDFPTGGSILGVSGIHAAYRTGRGSIVVRAHTEIEEMKNGRYRILVHDLPYQVNKARLIERIAELVKDKRIVGISDVRDESDRHAAVRIVVELKRDANANVVLNQLFKHTQMQDAFSANMLALVPGENGKYQPQIVNLIQMLQHYISHQKEVVTRRTHFELERAEARLHIVEGLQKAIDHIDEVISIIRASKNEDIAKTKLCERFDFTDKQAQHVVDMRLGRLSGLEREKLQKEHHDLEEKIAGFKVILTDSKALEALIKEELGDVRSRYANERRTEIQQGIFGDIDDESLIQEEDVMIAMTHLGYIKRMSPEIYSAQHRGGRGITAIQTKEEDFVESILITSTHDTLLFFTNMGKVYRLKGYQVPEAGRQARGMAIVNLLQLDADEKVYSVIPVRDFSTDKSLIMGTKEGVVKKSKLSAYANINKNGLIAISLRENDELIGARLVETFDDIIMVTRRGMAIRFSQDGIRETGRNTQGVRGIRLKKDDIVVGMVSTEANESLLVVTENGYGKRTELSEYRIQNRGGTGLITYKTSLKTGNPIGIALVNDDKDLLLINDQGIAIRLAVAEIPVLSRNTQGVTLMRSRDGKVVDLAIIDHVEEDEIEVAEGQTVEQLGETNEAEGSVQEQGGADSETTTTIE